MAFIAIRYSQTIISAQSPFHLAKMVNIEPLMSLRLSKFQT
ncbi:hypothetical protein GPLA_4275 [Paraglaciecola polaris LMG 21857]|uniref:Uncharacterized protein n=1 Tax=Paraglaciecola polaris LMG 21857 TaxID=1129793 RepID=K6YQZ8_9ALTE|nr:hypothetical protein GPLA_4275 [Paraglaciecola polaris LMG 21857]